MTKKKYIIGLDIGCSRIKLAACEILDSGLSVLASANVPSRGLKDGMVVDINNLSGAVSDAMEKLSASLDSKIVSVVVNISGVGVAGEESSGTVSLDQRSSEITPKDIKNVISVAKALPLGIDKEIMHVIPREYRIDNQKGVKNPLGLYGNKLELEAYVIYAKVSLIQNIVKCVNCAGFEVEEMVFSGLATASSVLSSEEKKDGVILIDAGSDFAEVSVFKDGNLIKMSIIKGGTRDLTDAISERFRINYDQAESLKNRYAVIRPPSGADGAVTSEGQFTNFHGISFNQKDLYDILYDKSKSLLGEINKEIEPFKKIVFSGIVVAGGMSLMEGFLELAEKELNLRSKIAIPKAPKGSSKDLTTAYATSLGLICYNYEKKRQEPSPKNIKNRFKRSFVKAKELFYDYF